MRRRRLEAVVSAFPGASGTLTIWRRITAARAHPMAEGAATKRAGSDSFPKAKPTRLVVGGIGSGLTLGSPATVSP